MPINTSSKIFVAGHRGMVGAAIIRALRADGYDNIVTRSKSELNLLDQTHVAQFFESEKLDHVVVAAAKVGGIQANNTYPAEFIYENLMIECNLIHQAYLSGVRELLFLGSSCIYPKFASQPMSERELLSGVLEPTNEPYAIAKIAGIKLCESYNRQYGTDYRSLMPTNLYGPGDNFDLENSHVIPALLRKFHDAKVNNKPSVEIWGTGSARREFLHVDDLASACLHVMKLSKDQYGSVTSPMLSHINAGVGEDVSIADLARSISSVVGYEGKLVFDTEKPDGTPRKLLEINKLLNLGWKPKIELTNGLHETYRWYCANQLELRL